MILYHKIVKKSRKIFRKILDKLDKMWYNIEVRLKVIKNIILNNSLSVVGVLDYANAIDLNMGATETKSYIPTQNGFVFLSGYGSANSFVSISCGSVEVIQQGASDNYVSCIFPVTKGVQCTLMTSAITNKRKTHFVPYK